MSVADWTIQYHARSGPLIAGGGGRLAPRRDVPAECPRAAAWCLFALSPGWSWLEDASDIAFAAQVSAAETEPGAVSSVASGKTS